MVEVAADDFHALEDKIHRTIEQLRAAREARTAAERETTRLRQQMAGRHDELESLRADVVALRREREEVRTRIEKMLKVIDSLTSGETAR